MLAGLLLQGCGVTRQIADVKTFGDCKYRVVSADSLYLAGLDVREFRSLDDLTNPLRYPKLAAALLQRNVPFQGRMNLEITNPTGRLAAVNQLEYRILLADNQITEGFVNQPVSVPAGGTTVVPIAMGVNAYQLIAEEQTRSSFLRLLENLSGRGSSEPSKITLKLRPTLNVGNQPVQYPGYITVNHSVGK